MSSVFPIKVLTRTTYARISLREMKAMLLGDEPSSFAIQAASGNVPSALLNMSYCALRHERCIPSLHSMVNSKLVDAGMAELADAAGLGPAGRKPLGVQIPLPAPSSAASSISIQDRLFTYEFDSFAWQSA